MLKTLILAIGLFACQKKPPHNHPLIDTVSKDTTIIFIMSGGTFDLDMGVIITSNTTTAKNFINSQLPSLVDDSDFHVRGAVFYEDGYPPILWLPSLPSSIEDYSIINHELFHLVVRVLNWAGVPLTESSEEVYAFEMQYISKQFYTNIVK